MTLNLMYLKACRWIKDVFNNEEGQGLVEYGLILALIAVVVIGALTLLGDEVEAIFDEVTDALSGGE